MKRELTKEQINFILVEMNKMQDEHPKARVVFDTERNEILITYPLPRDFHVFKEATNINPTTT